MIYNVKILFDQFWSTGGHFVLKIRLKSFLTHKKSPQNSQKWTKILQFISFFYFMNHFDKYVVVKDKYIKMHFCGRKIQILTYVSEKVTKIAW